MDASALKLASSMRRRVAPTTPTTPSSGPARLFDRSYVGAIGTLRAGPAAKASSARVGSTSISDPGSQANSSQVLDRREPDSRRPGTPLAWRLSTDNPNDLFDNFISLYRIDSGFAPPWASSAARDWETTGTWTHARRASWEFASWI